MSTLKADALTTKSDNTDLTITGGGTGVPNLESGFKVGGTVEKLTGVAPSTSGNVLTSDGTDWTSATAAGGGAWTFLGAGSASSAASIDFTSLVTDTYDSYVIVFSEFVPATATADLVLLTSSDNGSSWLSSGYLYHAQKLADDSTSYSAETGNTSSWLILDNQSAVSDRTGAGFIFVHSPTNASFRTRINSLSNGQENSGATTIGGSTIGCKNAAADNDALQLKYTSGNIATGEARLYGIANS